jgi:hypothetical protein
MREGNFFCPIIEKHEIKSAPVPVIVGKTFISYIPLQKTTCDRHWDKRKVKVALGRAHAATASNSEMLHTRRSS